MLTQASGLPTQTTSLPITSSPISKAIALQLGHYKGKPEAFKVPWVKNADRAHFTQPSDRKGTK